jgi:UDP:flavonoid glycosyltransferase YjiC (YdhE family)
MAMILNAAWTNYYSVPVRAPEHLKIARIAGSWLANLLAPMGKSWINKSGNKGFNKYRKEYGLPLRSNIYDTWRGDLNLMVDIPAYGPTNNLPSNFHYIGPIIWEPDIESPTWWKELEPNKPTIYFTMGSTGYARFFNQAIEIFGDSKYQCIMTTAGMLQTSTVPNNFFIVDYARGSEIMKLSDVVVCQGGNGTIYQAMSYGVPIIGIPTMHDQEYNLDRVEALGMGIQLSEIYFKPTDLVDAVEEILNNEKYRISARYYMDILSEYNGPKRGAELIDLFLQS